MQEVDPTALGTARVLAVGAHPDDAEYYAGGTLARFADAGANVTLLVCTGGGRGGRGLDDPVAARASEQANAARIIPFHARSNLGRADGELVNDDALRERLVHALRRLKPDIVFTHDPRALFAPVRDRFRLQHSDHRARARACWIRCTRARPARTSTPSSSPSPASSPGTRARSGSWIRPSPA